MIKQATKTRKSSERQLTILAGIRKPSGMICAKVCNDQGKDYFVTVKNGVGTCQCDGNAKWHKQCYHIKAVIEAEYVFGPEGLLIDEIAAQAEQANMQKLQSLQNAYETLAPTKQVSQVESCRYCGHNCRGGVCGRCAA